MSDLKNDKNTLENSCGCGHDHDHDHAHDHEHIQTMTLELENGEKLICPIIEIFEVEGKEYISLLHPDEDLALLYGFSEYEDDSVELTEIESDEEYEKVSNAFRLLGGEGEDEEE